MEWRKSSVLILETLGDIGKFRILGSFTWSDPIFLLLRYTCPNGHVFTIGEVSMFLLTQSERHLQAFLSQCGMAMVLSDCPECGARIGGTSHQLVHGNARADDLERLL